MANQAPLQQSERERLWRWERFMRRYYIIAMGLMVIASVLAFAYGETAWVRRSLLGLVLLLVIVAAPFQLSQKCPRCGSRLKLKSGFMLPDKCRVCRVEYGRPPRSGLGPGGRGE